MRVGFLIIYISLVSTQSIAQNLADSLQRILPRAEGTKKVDILNQLTYECIGTNNAAALHYSNDAIDLANSLGYTKGIGTAYTYRGVYEYLSGENAVGINYLKKALPWIKKANDREMEGYTYLQMGNSYMNLTIFDSSQLSYEHAYEILKDSTNPVTLSKLYKNLGTLYGLRSAYDLQLKFVNRSLAIREQLGDGVLIADALVEIARINASRSDFDKASAHLARAEKILMANPSDEENLNDYRHVKALLLIHDTKFEEAFVLLDSAKNFYERTSMLMKMITLHIDLGTVFMGRGEYEVALKNYYAALRIAESKGFTVQTIDIETRLGWVNFFLGEFQQALNLANRSLAKAKEKNIPDRVANAGMLLGVTHTDLKNYQQAEKFLNESLSIRKQSRDSTLISEAYVNLGYLKERLKDFDGAENDYLAGIDFAMKNNYLQGIAWSKLGLANIYLSKSNYAKAIQLYGEAEGYAKTIRDNEVLIRVYEGRRDLLAKQGKFRESLRFSMLADHWKDSLHRKDVARRFINLQKIDEIEKRDRDIKALEQEQRLAKEKISYQQAVLNQQYMLIAAAVLGLILLAVIAVVYARFYFKIKRLNHLIQEKNENIQRQADKLREANDELGKLYREVTEQKEEIQAQSEELTENYQHISTMNQSLQVLVDEKTRDLLKTNEELIKQNNELLQFSYTVSHNLRGPVARLLGLSDLLFTTGNSGEREMFIHLIHKTSQDLDGVMRDLSKIIDVRNELHQIKERIDLEKEWQKCCDLVRDLIPTSAIIQFDFRTRELFTIRAMIHSIFYNLLSNAIKYKSPKRNLQITGSTQSENGMLRIDFEDNGLGIDLAKYQHSIFKLFKRFHTHVEGRGLGLYLIKSQIGLLNGSIHIASKVDHGTHFTIFIPETSNVSASEVPESSAPSIANQSI